MFSFFKTPEVDKLTNKRRKMLEEAMHTQRSGDLKAYAQLMESIDKIEKEIEVLQPRQS